MRGEFENAELRKQSRALWAEQHVPAYMVGEVRPLSPLLARENDLVLVDVGANKGFWTKAFLNVFGERVRHSYMLDPSPANFAELSPRPDSLIFDPDDFRRISAHNVAAGFSVGEGILYTNEDGSPLASLYAHKLSGKAGTLGMEVLSEELPVSVTTIDEFVSANNIEHIDVLKIATEGHEYDVLAGARNCFLTGMIDCVLFEFGCYQVGSRNFFVDFFTLFKELGYEIYNVADNRLISVPEYSYVYENFSRCFAFAAHRKAAGPVQLPEGFTEEGYLKYNPDVEEAVKAGHFASGFEHWLKHGVSEGRHWPVSSSSDIDAQLLQQKAPTLADRQKLSYYNEEGRDHIRYWPLTPEYCPCDIHFREYLASKNVCGKSIFHFGTGIHHLVGSGESEGSNQNYVLGVTASPEEYVEYESLIINRPELAQFYKVIFTDIYTFHEASLPEFDIVTLFHLCEYWDPIRSAYAPLDDRKLLELMIKKLRPGGQIVAFSGSATWAEARPLFDAAVEAKTLAAGEEFKSLIFFRKCSTPANT
jgi:FkbM family methyltransferase